MRKFSKEQEVYMLAKAHYQAVIAEQTRRCEVQGIDELYETDFDSAFEREEAVRAELGADEAYNLYRDAEVILVSWAFTVIENQPIYKKNIGDLESLRAETKNCIVTREKVANLAMKMAI